MIYGPPIISPIPQDSFEPSTVGVCACVRACVKNPPCWASALSLALPLTRHRRLWRNLSPPDTQPPLLPSALLPGRFSRPGRSIPSTSRLQTSQPPFKGPQAVHLARPGVPPLPLSLLSHRRLILDRELGLYWNMEAPHRIATSGMVTPDPRATVQERPVTLSDIPTLRPGRPPPTLPSQLQTGVAPCCRLLRKAPTLPPSCLTVTFPLT